jgi:hypothetical protein
MHQKKDILRSYMQTPIAGLEQVEAHLQTCSLCIRLSPAVHLEVDRFSPAVRGKAAYNRRKENV